MLYKYLFFDLDGTITDSAPGITNSCAYALSKYGINETNEQLKRFVGPPLIPSWMKSYGFSEETAKQALEYYREYFVEKGIYENYPYDGIKEVLLKLKNAGMKIVLATSKPEPYAERIVEYFEMTDIFDLVAGSTLSENRSKKVEVIEYAIDKMNIKDRSEVLMIGDRSYDIKGAALAGIDSMGVLYGYGTKEEVEKAKYIAATVEDIANIILSL